MSADNNQRIKSAASSTESRKCQCRPSANARLVLPGSHQKARSEYQAVAGGGIERGSDANSAEKNRHRR